ncbi:sugar ABC transporter permease [Actinomycetospora sp. NBRC 106375]|uniref:carbohydrate ABC transporter permease n=1 Tax=Actinomycetospora sp. NBRC 106375 TaxID=3032207 RepID=UPI0024A31559|nr:carbohydrate ABC transporter permease [Actinomycetospora sp. NBRC 106375]GLZ46250.1 sugar ABC transporter permease [Actinomycetospora sp. NBRC 106375]
MAVTTSTPPDTQEPAAPPEPRRQKRSAANVWLGVIAWVVGIAFFFPVFWMVLTSFKQETDAYTTTPKIIFEPTLEQYEGVFAAGVGPYVVNSVIATVFSTLFVLVLGIPAAFAVSLRPVKKTQDVLFFFISTKMLPVVAVIVPIYVVVNQIGMLDNIWTLVVLYTGMNLPIAVWMMRSFFLEVPGELLEQASIDGAPLWRTLREIVLPIISPGIFATALICVIFAWNEFFFAVNLTAANAGTMPVFLVGFITSEGLYWAQLSAAATLAALPVVIAGWVAQNKLVQGLSFGAVK